MTPDQMITSQTYKVTYKVHRSLWEMKATFLGYRPHDKAYAFDLRPGAGTTPVPADMIYGIEPADLGIHQLPKRLGTVRT